MDLSLSCIVSLSKKMRTLIGEGNSTIVLHITNVKGGRGDGKLLISSDEKMVVPDDFLKHETSIMITPLDVKEEVPGKSGVGNLFTANANQTKTGLRTPVDRLAAMEAPSTNREIANAIATEEEVDVPAQLKPTPNSNTNQRFRSYVKNLQELTAAVNAARNKVSSVDIENIDDSTVAGKRQKAAAMEMKEMEESIDVEAFVVNRKFASLVINDLGIQLGLDVPYDLSKISAKRIAGSRELRSLISDGSIEIISPQQAIEMRRNYRPPETPGSLEAYSVDEAFDRVFEGKGGGMQASELRVNVDDLDEATEEQQLASLVRTPVPTRTVSGGAGTVLSGGIRKTAHRASFGGDNEVTSGGGTPSLEELTDGLPHQTSRVPDRAKVNPQGIKTIAKKR